MTLKAPPPAPSPRALREAPWASAQLRKNALGIPGGHRRRGESYPSSVLGKDVRSQSCGTSSSMRRRPILTLPIQLQGPPCLPTRRGSDVERAPVVTRERDRERDIKSNTRIAE